MLNKPGRARARQRGFALLIVMWSLGLLALLGTQLTGTGRSEVRVATNLRGNAMAQAAADGAVQVAVLRMLQGSWAATSATHELHLGNMRVLARSEDQSTKINPNATTAPVLQALLNNLGVDQASAALLATAIIDWRTGKADSLFGGTKVARYQAAGLGYAPTNRPFESTEQVALVLGMTTPVFARLRPYLSVYQEGDVSGPGGEDAAANARVEAGTVRQGGVGLGYVSRNTVTQITTEAWTQEGARFRRRAVVRLKASPRPDEAPYQILTWETANGDP